MYEIDEKIKQLRDSVDYVILEEDQMILPYLNKRFYAKEVYIFDDVETMLASFSFDEELWESTDYYEVILAELIENDIVVNTCFSQEEDRSKEINRLYSGYENRSFIYPVSPYGENLAVNILPGKHARTAFDDFRHSRHMGLEGHYIISPFIYSDENELPYHLSGEEFLEWTKSTPGYERLLKWVEVNSQNSTSEMKIRDSYEELIKEFHKIGKMPIDQL